MPCLLCSNLEQVFEARRNEYLRASSLASRFVSSKFVAYMNVEMERALNDLQDHRSVCHGKLTDVQALQAVSRIRNAGEAHRVGHLESVA